LETLAQFFKDLQDAAFKGTQKKPVYVDISVKLENDSVMISAGNLPFETLESYVENYGTEDCNMEIPEDLLHFFKKRLAKPDAKMNLEMSRILGIGGEGIVLRKKTKIRGQMVDCAFKLSPTKTLKTPFLGGSGLFGRCLKTLIV